MDISGNGILVYTIFFFAYISDVPQQNNNNSGFEEPRANLSCRTCFTGIQQRGNLQFDVSANSRY
jgi:hypothetical protein